MKINAEHELLNIRQNLRDQMRAILKRTPIDADMYKEVKLELKACNKVLRLYFRMKQAS